MVAEAVVWVDVESAVRAWARDNVPSAERRVFFGANDKVSGDQLVLQRVGGPDGNCLIQFDCWSSTKEGAAALAADLATEADALATYVFDGVRLHAASTEQSRWLPDPESDAPRYVVDITFVASATS